MTISALSSENFEQVFPFHVAFSKDGKISSKGKTLAKIAKEKGKSGFFGEFSISNPGDMNDFDSICSKLGSMFIMTHNKSGLSLKGQFLRQDDDQLVFVGSPKVNTVEELGAFGLDMKDFAIHDQVSDLLIQMQSQTMALNESREMSKSLRVKNKKLKASEESLRKASQELEKQCNRMEAFNAFCLEAASVREEKNLFKMALEAMLPTLKFQFGTVWTCDEAGSSLETLAETADGPKLPFDLKGITGEWLGTAGDELVRQHSEDSEDGSERTIIVQHKLSKHSRLSGVASLIFKGTVEECDQWLEEGSSTQLFVKLFAKHIETLWENIDFLTNLQDLVAEKTRHLKVALDKVEESNKKIKVILDNLEQGIVTFGEDFLISDEFSPYLCKLFDKAPSDIGGQPVFDALLKNWQVSDDARNSATEALGVSLGDSSFNWDMNVDLLPRECVVSHGEKELILGMQWTPILNSDDEVGQVLLAIQDLTEQRALELAAEREKERSERMAKVIQELSKHDRGKIAGMLQGFQDRVDSVGNMIRTKFDEKIAFRDLHTIKGEARTRGLKLLAEKAHDVESLVKEMGGQSGSGVGQEFATSFEALSAVFHSYRSIAQDVLGIGGSGSSEPQEVSLFDLVGELQEAVYSQLHAAHIPFRGITVKDEVLSWSSELVPDLKAILMHALTNGCDHGYILPLSKGIPARPATFAISALRVGPWIQLNIDDTGAGIDIERIAAKANIDPTTLRSPMEITRLLTEDGFSTAETVTETSGRGVGLSAICGIASKLGGSALVSPNEQGGTRVSVYMADRQFFNPGQNVVSIAS